MRPAHQAREVKERRVPQPASGAASMRPAHQAREVRSSAGRRGRPRPRFNEARASSAGSNDWGGSSTPMLIVLQ